MIVNAFHFLVVILSGVTSLNAQLFQTQKQEDQDYMVRNIFPEQRLVNSTLSNILCSLVLAKN